MGNHNYLNEIHQKFGIFGKETSQYSPLTLAYLGDAVYEIIIRTIVVEGKSGGVNTLHQNSSRFVNAKAQADIVSAIEDKLSEEELTIYKRGRNAKPHSVAKNAEVRDYRMATGFEALVGYLYLSGEMERCLDLIRLGLDAVFPQL